MLEYVEKKYNSWFFFFFRIRLIFIDLKIWCLWFRSFYLLSSMKVFFPSTLPLIRYSLYLVWRFVWRCCNNSFAIILGFLNKTAFEKWYSDHRSGRIVRTNSLPDKM